MWALALIAAGALWLWLQEQQNAAGGAEWAGLPILPEVPEVSGIGPEAVSGDAMKLPGKLPVAVSALIDKYAAEFGVNPNLAKAQAWQESRGNQNAVSSAGAIGVFQLMPGTAADLGVNPYNVEENIKGGIRYLAQQLNRFGADESLALAAYNAGPGNVQKYGGIPPFQETQNYVAKILGYVAG